MTKAGCSGTVAEANALALEPKGMIGLSWSKKTNGVAANNHCDGIRTAAPRERGRGGNGLPGARKTEFKAKRTANRHRLPLRRQICQAGTNGRQCGATEIERRIATRGAGQPVQRDEIGIGSRRAGPGFGLNGFDQPFDGAGMGVSNARREAAVTAPSDPTQKAARCHFGFNREMHHVVRNDTLLGAIDWWLWPGSGGDVEPVNLAGAFGERQLHRVGTGSGPR